MTQRISVLLLVTGAAALIAGVVLLTGIGWAIITGGVMALVAAILLYDPNAGTK